MLWSLLRTWFLATSAFYALRPAVSAALFLVFGAGELLCMCLGVAAAVCLKGRSVLEVRERTEEPECLRDPALGAHEFVTLDDGVTLHYVSAGSRDRPLVLLLHGFPDIWYTWHKQILELKKNYW
ncbi:epoxide hydrolase 3-like [Dermacentor variabilis]